MFRILASCFGVGFLPKAPGTYGSIFAVLFWFLFRPYNILNYVLLLVFILVLSVLVTHYAIKGETEKDPSWIVIDEFIGNLVALIPVVYFGASIYWAILSFVLFRFFDISKILFISNVESLKGAWGIVLDDVIAGLYAMLLLFLFYKIF